MSADIIFVVLAIERRSSEFFSKTTVPVSAFITIAERAETDGTGTEDDSYDDIGSCAFDTQIGAKIKRKTIVNDKTAYFFTKQDIPLFFI
ncbi:MAG: hypothetical protein FWG70_04350 [Oscillospiraceae bacterium]|nr:hypothetical protein [Oscillospiraceae bacterium]